MDNGSDQQRKNHKMDVGSRLRQLRLEREKSMRSLARESGLSTNALSMIERGRTSPSVSTLHKLANALEVPITAFFRLEPDRSDIVFRRKSERSTLNLSNGIWEGLGGEAFTGQIEAFVISIEPGTDSGSFGMVHSGDEFVLCQKGQIEYMVDEQTIVLEAGDSLIFAAQLSHRWRNTGLEPAQLIVVIAGFEHGEQPSEFHTVR